VATASRKTQQPTWAYGLGQSRSNVATNAVPERRRNSTDSTQRRALIRGVGFHFMRTNAMRRGVPHEKWTRG
jgi:hypothetical protein